MTHEAAVLSSRMHTNGWSCICSTSYAESRRFMCLLDGGTKEPVKPVRVYQRSRCLCNCSLCWGNRSWPGVCDQKSNTGINLDESKTEGKFGVGLLIAANLIQTESYARMNEMEMALTRCVLFERRSCSYNSNCTDLGSISEKMPNYLCYGFGPAYGSAYIFPSPAILKKCLLITINSCESSSTAPLRCL